MSVILDGNDDDRDDTHTKKLINSVSILQAFINYAVCLGFFKSPNKPGEFN